MKPNLAFPQPSRRRCNRSQFAPDVLDRGFRLASVAKHAALLLVGLVMLAGGFTAADTGDDVASALMQLRHYDFGGDTAPIEQVRRAVEAARHDPAGKSALAERLAQFLNTEASYAAKQFICRQLVLIAGEKQIPALARWLTDDQLSHMVQYVLLRLPSPQVEAALRAALPASKGRTRIGLINALGARRDPEAVGLLAPLLKDTSPGTTEAAAEALGRIGTPEAEAVLRTAWLQAQAAHRRALEAARLRAAAALGRAGNRAAALVVYRELFDKGSPLHQAAALRGLAELEPAQAAPRLRSALLEGDRPLRNMAARLARELPGNTITSMLTALLQEAPPHLQLVLLDVLADRADRSAAPVVRRLTEHHLPEVRLEAIKALGSLGGSESVYALALRAAEAQGEEQAAARTALASLAGQDVDAALLKELVNSRPPKVMVEVIRAVGARKVSAAIPRLFELAEARDASVAKAACAVLGQLCDARHLDRLIDLMTRLQSSRSEPAEQALVEVARRTGQTARVAQRVSTQLKNAVTEAEKIRLLELLGQLGGPTSLQVAESTLQHSSGELRAAALRILAAWPTAEPLPSLLDVMRHARTSTEKNLALRGVIRLAAAAEDLPVEERLKIYREAMESADSAEPQRQVLSGLAKLHSKAALDYAARWLDEPDLRQEAELAVVSIARAICGAYREDVRAILTRLAGSAVNATAKERAREVLAQIERFDGFITAWAYSPAYERAGAGCAQLFDIPFPPETAEASEVRWRLLPACMNPEQPWLADLLAVLPGEQRVAYLRTYLWSDPKQTVRMEMGSDDGIKVWLNGRLVYARNVMRAVAPGQEKFDLTLEAGWNELKVKVTQNIMGWGVCGKIVKPDGSPAVDVRASIEPTE